MRIFLTGLPASGKSIVGKSLGKLTGFPFLDLDDVIEEHAGNTIERIFKKNGEEAFRSYERAALKKVIHGHKDVVLATGGGTPCYNDNLELINNNGVMIYLKARIQTLLGRIEKDEGRERPLLERDVKSRLKELRSKRQEYYNKAELIINVDDKSPDELAREILNNFKS